jgi:hypothetical protein
MKMYLATPKQQIYKSPVIAPENAGPNVSKTAGTSARPINPTGTAIRCRDCHLSGSMV